LALRAICRHGHAAVKTKLGRAVYGLRILARRLSLRGETRAPAALDVFCYIARGLRRKHPAFASRKRRFRFIEGGKHFRAGAFAFLPEREGFFYGVFLARNPSALDGLADKGLLIGRQLHFHTSRVRAA